MTCEVRVVRFYLCQPHLLILLYSISISTLSFGCYISSRIHGVLAMFVELTPPLWKSTLETSDMWFLNKVASLVANADVKGS